MKDFNLSLKESMEVFSKRVTVTDLHLKKKKIILATVVTKRWEEGEEPETVGSPLRGLWSTSGLQPERKGSGPGWWAGQPEREALNLAS